MPVSFETLKRWYKASRAATDDWRDEAKALKEFVAGQQWSAEDAEKLRKEDRPPVVFNRSEVIVDAICGAEMNNRHETSFEPVEVGDTGTSAVMTSAVAWARHRCQADDEESDAFRDLVITGLGCTRTAPDYDGDQPEVVIERVDTDEVVWDHRAKKRNLRDRRYAFRARKLDATTAKEAWPDQETEDIDATWAEHDAPTTTSSGLPGRAYEAGRDSGGSDQKDVTVVEVEWWERVTRHRVIAAGQVIEVDQDQYRALTRRLEQLGEQFETQKQRRKVYYRAVMGRETLLERHKLDPQKGGFRFKFMTGKRERNEKGDGYLWYGVARSCKDPQQWANKFFSQILHIINSTALGGVIFEADAFADPRKAQQNWAKANSWIEAQRNALTEGRIKEREQAPTPVAMVQMLEFAIHSIRECAGVNPELLGQVQREQPGVLEYQRRQAGMNVLAVLFDALKQYREEQGYLMLHMVLTHMADGRLIRLVGERGAQYVPLVREEGATEYDVRVSEAPSAPDQKERSWQMIQTVIPYLVKAEVPGAIWAEIVRHSPLPPNLADKIAQVFDEREQQQMTPEQQISLQTALAELDKTKSAAEENRASALLDMAKAKELDARVSLDALSQARETAAQMGQPGPLEQAQIDERQEMMRQTGERERQREQLASQERQARERASQQRQSQR